MRPTAVSFVLCTTLVACAGLEPEPAPSAIAGSDSFAVCSSYTNLDDFNDGSRLIDREAP